MKRPIMVALVLLGITAITVAQETKSAASKEAPQAIGPYSQAVKAAGFVFASGQIAIDPATGKMVEGDIRVQTERVLNNLSAVLKAAGTGMGNVVKTTVYLKNMSDFPAMNEVYARAFSPVTPPARATVQVVGLPRDALVEIDAVASTPQMVLTK